MSSDVASLSGIEKRYADELVGKVACFDRIIIFGTWQGLRYEGAVSNELARRGWGAFELKRFAQPLSDAVRARATALAQEHGVEVIYLPNWRIDKEEIAQAQCAQRGRQPGLVCILSVLESCQTFEPRKGKEGRPAWIKMVPGRCLHVLLLLLRRGSGADSFAVADLAADASAFLSQRARLVGAPTPGGRAGSAQPG